MQKVNTELDKFYVDKIKEMDLQEPELFTIMIFNLLGQCISALTI